MAEKRNELNRSLHTASADEIKYRTKYKQLRGKVKEIEEVSTSLLKLPIIGGSKACCQATFEGCLILIHLLNAFCLVPIHQENAKMQAKILKTKRQIQRLRLERR